LNNLKKILSYYVFMYQQNYVFVCNTFSNINNNCMVRWKSRLSNVYLVMYGLVPVPQLSGVQGVHCTSPLNGYRLPPRLRESVLKLIHNCDCRNFNLNKIKKWKIKVDCIIN